MVTSFSDSVTIRPNRARISCYQLFQMRRTDVTTAEESNANVYSNSVIYFGMVFTLIIIYDDIFVDQHILMN
jgi:hypothetical protein